MEKSLNSYDVTNHCDVRWRVDLYSNINALSNGCYVGHLLTHVQYIYICLQSNLWFVNKHIVKSNYWSVFKWLINLRSHFVFFIAYLIYNQKTLWKELVYFISWIRQTQSNRLIGTIWINNTIMYIFFLDQRNQII